MALADVPLNAIALVCVLHGVVRNEHTVKSLRHKSMLHACNTLLCAAPHLLSFALRFAGVLQRKQSYLAQLQQAGMTARGAGSLSVCCPCMTKHQARGGGCRYDVGVPEPASAVWCGGCEAALPPLNLIWLTQVAQHCTHCVYTHTCSVAAPTKHP